MQTFDAVIIGSGQGGTPLAKKLAGAGMKTLIVEKRLIGGTCINDGCTPTKAMIASAKRAYAVHNSHELGIESSLNRIDFARIVERKNKIVYSFREASKKGLEETAHLTIVYGEAFFSGVKTITINLSEGGQETYTAEHFFINTGCTPFIPDIEGLNKIHYHTSTTLLDMEKIPGHLVVLGGSYIALEFAQMFRRFGSEVTIIDQAPSFLPHEDEDIAQSLLKVLQDEGIQVLVHTATRHVEANDKLVSITVSTAGQIRIITGSDILIATGRTPQTAALHLHAAGIETDEKGFIKVNEYLETSAAGVYALGDVKGGPAFTHIAYNDHLVLLKNLLSRQKTSIMHRPVPYTLFTDPQLGRIGLSEKEARRQGLNIKVVTLPMEKTARGIETGETRGLMKAVVDADSKQILGAAILAAEGGEVITILEMAMAGRITYETVREMIFAHPLYAESLNNLFLPLDK